MAVSGVRARAVLLALVIVVALVPGRLPSALTTGPTVTWTDPIEVAAGTAFRGPWRMNDSAFDFVDDPTVAIDARGRVAVVWADHARKDLFFQRYGPDGKAQLDGPVNVSRSPRVFSWLPRLVLPADDPLAVHVARHGFNGSQQGLLMRKLAVDAGGAIAVVNSTFWANEASRVRLFRGHAGERQ